MSVQREQKITALKWEATIERAAERWKEKQAALKLAEKEAEVAQTELITACGNQSYEGKGVKVAEIERVGSVDFKAIPELKAVDLEQYRKPGSKYFKITLSLVQ